MWVSAKIRVRDARSIIWIFPGLVISSSAARSQAYAELVESSDQAPPSVLAANEDFYKAFNQKDLTLMDDLWATSDDISCIHPGWNVLQGREAVLESWHGILSNANQPRIVVGGATVVFSGNAAVVLCRELVAGSPLAATNVFVKHGEDWKLLHHQSGPVSV